MVVSSSIFHYIEETKAIKFMPLIKNQYIFAHGSNKTKIIPLSE